MGVGSHVQACGAWDMSASVKSFITPSNDGRFHCLRGCGDSWDTNPQLAVECPTCHARAGLNCIAPSEHRKSASFAQPHAARRKLAFEQAPCGCLARWDAEHTVQPGLFAGGAA